MILAILNADGAIGGVLAATALAFVQWILNKKKQTADTTHVLTEAMNLLIAPMNARITELQAEVSHLRLTTDSQRHRIEILEAELIRHKIAIPIP